MDFTFTLLVAVVAGGLLWFAFQPRYVFVVRIDKGVPRVAKGKVTMAFVHEVEQVCAEAQLATGWLGGVRRGHGIALAFSRSIPRACQQRLRNLWPIVG